MLVLSSWGRKQRRQRCCPVDPSEEALGQEGRDQLEVQQVMEDRDQFEVLQIMLAKDLGQSGAGAGDCILDEF